MKHEVEVDASWVIPEDRFTPAYVETRLANVPTDHHPSLRSALNYLYVVDGAKTLDRSRLIVAETYLSPAERALIRWLHTRSNGSERKNYGPDSVVAAKISRHRCKRCRYPDVRSLHIDHVHGRSEGAIREFECLCANCHAVKSREKDWMKPKVRHLD